MLHSKSVQDMRSMSNNTKDVAAMMAATRAKKQGKATGGTSNIKRVYFTPELCGKYLRKNAAILRKLK